MGTRTSCYRRFSTKRSLLGKEDKALSGILRHDDLNCKTNGKSITSIIGLSFTIFLGFDLIVGIVQKTSDCCNTFGVPWSRCKFNIGS